LNIYFALASGLAFIVGIVHSALGETLIFRHMRKGTFIPTNGHPILQERHVRILWASWHLVTVFGWGLAAILFWLSIPSPHDIEQTFIENTVLFSMLIAALVVLVATKGKHPGWIGLLGVAILVWIG